MAYSIKQQPTTVSLSQSPIVFSVEETDTSITATGSFQYFGDLYYWQGGSTNQGSVPNFTFAKYPNQSNTGIFDVSKVINSSLYSISTRKPFTSILLRVRYILRV